MFNFIFVGVGVLDDPQISYDFNGRPRWSSLRCFNWFIIQCVADPNLFIIHQQSGFIIHLTFSCGRSKPLPYGETWVLSYIIASQTRHSALYFDLSVKFGKTDYNTQSCLCIFCKNRAVVFFHNCLCNGHSDSGTVCR